MITGLDHLVLLCPEIVSGVAVYERLLGRKADWGAEVEGGGASALFRLGNTSLELLAPAGEGPLGQRLAELIEVNGPGLTTLAFGSDGLAADREIFVRRGLEPGDIKSGQSRHAETGAERRWQSLRLPDEKAGGIKVFVVEPGEGALAPAPAAADAVHGLDHAVVNTAAPDRALAFYGAKLGLRLAMDRTNPDWGVRLIFFRTGGLTIEIARRLSEPEDTGRPDTFWGLTWAVKDIEAAHKRLTDSGFDISEIRKGRKPGSRVFTIRNGTMNVPTLFIAHETV
ncbi:glyoxalase family protein [Hyphomonas polymorpha PS728]|uniref:Glyoxalase family protein n=1 Tax=Hyphomonas polymorpha PS728 TaxID=1280954 RepID=A0A062VKH7_9PROT|nr:VOC family protein [Hyphomonas polymorpha]KCZ98626.1 glyoxalase family protein [Hyphomonas polymorpha PS728]